MLKKTLAHYELQDKIGQGGMGEVYRARDTQLDREVAIKILPEVFSQDTDRLARFEREAKLLASVNHPGIAAVYGLHQDNGVHFLAMELVPGMDLAKRLETPPIPMPLDEILDLSSQIAAALEAAHEQGVVHRDLKPSNVVVTPDNKAKVLDFGLAKSMDASPSFSDISQSPTLAVMGTVEGVILGTAAYMSPEQARGKPVDKRSDIWAFGVILYEMLTGKQLFQGETISDTMAGVLKSRIDFDALPPSTPPALKRLVERCLDRKYATRLRDIGEARITLANILAGETGEAAMEASPQSPGFLRSYGGWIAAGLAVLAAIGSQISTGKTTPAPEAPLRKAAIVMEREDPSLRDAYSPVLSPDGRYLAYLSHDQLWLRDLTAIRPQPIAGTQNATNVFWSPDGEWIGFVQGNTLKKAPRTGGTPSLVASVGGGTLSSGSSGLCWTEDGLITIGTGTGPLLRVSAQGGEVVTCLETEEGESDFHQVSALPDGRGFVLVVHDTSGIGRLDLWTPDGERTTLVDLDDNVAYPCYSSSGHILFSRGGSSAGLWAFPFSLKEMKRTGEPFLVEAGALHPSTGEDGSLVYVTGASVKKAQMVVVDRTGVVTAELGPIEEVSLPFPGITRDGRSVLHCSNFGDATEVYLYDIARGNRQRITFNDLRENFALDHPNGRDVVFYDGREFNTYVHPLAGGGEPKLLTHGVMAQVTRDGSTLVYARKKEKSFDFDLVTRPYDGSEADEQVLVKTPAVEWWPQLSPDENYLMYTSDETGRDEVYLITFPKADARWQVSTEGGNWPRWSADGATIYYCTRESILSVDVNLQGRLTLGEPKTVFNRIGTGWSSNLPDGFDVTADEARFVLFRPVLEESEAPNIVVVQNWFQEFRAS